MSAKTNSAWGKWRLCTFSSEMSLDDQIKLSKKNSRKLGPGRRRSKRKWKRLRWMAQAMIDGASASQVALLKKVLTKFCQLHIRQGMKAWKAKVHAKTAMMSIVCLPMQINYGFRRWLMVAVKDKCAGQLKMEQFQR